MPISIIVVGLVVVGVLFLLTLGNKSSSDSIKTSSNYTEEGVKNYLRAGRKIEAIKCYREMTGVGLKDAKEAVEAMELD